MVQKNLRLILQYHKSFWIRFKKRSNDKITRRKTSLTIVTAFIGGFDQSYKGSIYVDDTSSFDGKALKVTKTALNVKVGKKVTIKVMATLVAKVTYKSSNKKIVTVMDKGVVKGVKKGKATITVKANGKTVKVKVAVK